MKYQIAVFLKIDHSAKLRTYLISKSFSIYRREISTQCLSTTKKIIDHEEIELDEANIYPIGTNSRYECFYNGNDHEEVEDIMAHLSQDPAVLSYRVSYANNDDNRIFY